MLIKGLELATPQLKIECSSHQGKYLNRWCWEGVEFIQMVDYITIYSPFLICDHFSSVITSHPRSTLFLQDTATPGTSREDAVRMLIKTLEVAKELNLSGWCIALSYIYHFLPVIDFSSEKYIV